LGLGKSKELDAADVSIDRGHIHTKSSSLSSIGFVSAVKTASISLASFTGPATSRKTRQSAQQRSGTRSSRFSDNEARLSIDSSGLPAAVIDEGTRDRAVKRRRVLEELLSTEESYIADLKILINVGHILPNPSFRANNQRYISHYLHPSQLCRRIPGLQFTAMLAKYCSYTRSSITSFTEPSPAL
jgi:hypothetical protein